MRQMIAIVLTLLVIAPVHAAGLLAPTDETLPPLRITDHLVEVDIRDGVAITEVTQTFRNDTNRRLEATYVFPLAENADLTDFQMSFNGKMVQGEILPAEEAARIYESIVRQMKDPGLIEFIGRRLLQMRVFPIEPESDTRIKVRYQQICRPVSGMTAYHYPLRTRKTGGQAYGEVRFSVDLESSDELKSIWSPTHAVEIVRDPDEHSAKIAYEAAGGSLDEDFLLLYDTDDSDLGLSVVAWKPSAKEDGAFVLMLTPKQLWPDEEFQPQDVVFVIDTSGSMAAEEKIGQAKSALKFCIDKLDERDRFSVVRFSTGFDVLFEDLREATKENRKEAREWVEKFTAAGGTNISDTLLHVLAMKPQTAGDSEDEGERAFVVVFLTDGKGNRQPAEIMNRLAEGSAEKAGVRIFPFGVGHDVNTILLDQLADTYTGRTTYVQPGENLELVLGDFFSVISRPVLTNLTLSLPDIGATERFPATLGDLYHGQQLIIAGRFDEPATGTVTLTARRGGEKVEYSWPKVAFTHTESAEYVPSVWAGRKIAFLIDEIRRSGESTEMVEEILALSQEYGIQTPYSSWLVNPEQVRLGHAPVAGRRGPARRHPPVGSAPGPASGGFGGGRGGGGADSAILRERLREAAGEESDHVFIDGQTDTFYGDEFGEIDLILAQEAVTADSGEAANLIARRNAEMKDLRSRDEGRLDSNLLLHRKINGRWYNRLGQYLVDEGVGEDTEILVVRFASPAYFELVRERPELRAALAASTHVVVLAAGDTAVLVSDRAGIENFSADERKQVQLGER